MIHAGAGAGSSMSLGHEEPEPPKHAHRCPTNPDDAVTAAVIGAGARGKTYARYGLEQPSKLRIVAVAEPRDFSRNLIQSRHRVPDGCAVSDWRELARRPRLADCVIIATQDSDHVQPVLAFAELGYHILLEKPMAVTAEDCRAIVDAVKRNGVILAVCHVLRYTPYQQKIQELLSSGAIGEVVNIQHLEPIGNVHFAHSYVRGSWRKESESTFMLMAKCCHDVDLIRYMVGRRCEKLSSFGTLQSFHPSRKPEGAGSRCLDCPIEASCTYSARKIYLNPPADGHMDWLAETIVDGRPTKPAITKVLETGPYGRCVWDCDNDVADHQVVSMQFEGGVSATLTAVAFSEQMCVRRTRVFGTKGELDGDGLSSIRVYDFATRTAKVHVAALPPSDTTLQGHGGADYFLIANFVRAVRENNPDLILSGCEETLESHLMVFAAERARVEGRVVNMAEMWDETEGSVEGEVDVPDAVPVEEAPGVDGEDSVVVVGKAAPAAVVAVGGVGVGVGVGAGLPLHRPPSATDVEM